MNKNFKKTGAEHINKFFTPQEEQGGGEEEQKATTPKPKRAAARKPISKPTAKPENYRISLKLRADLEDFIDDITWAERISVTQYINNLILADRERRKGK